MRNLALITIAALMFIFPLSANANALMLTCDFKFAGNSKIGGAIVNSEPSGCADEVISFLKDKNQKRYNLLSADLKYANPPECPPNHYEVDALQYSILSSELTSKNMRESMYQVRRICASSDSKEQFTAVNHVD